MPRLNLAGVVFDKLTVIKFSHSNTRKEAVWECICQCGKTTMVKSASLTSGHTKSCGCYQLEVAAKVNTKHGFSSSDKMHISYPVWQSMKERCRNKKLKSYKDYGGRGIKVCKRWLNSFTNFINDMGERPTLKHTIDRIDNNKGYYNGNCKWSTITEQTRNRRNNVWVDYLGQRMLIIDFKRDVCKTISTRIDTLIKTMSPEQIAIHYERKRNKLAGL